MSKWHESCEPIEESRKRDPEWSEEFKAYVWSPAWLDGKATRGYERLAARILELEDRVAAIEKERGDV